ncbi:hypothetical protein GCM10023196_005030 [Actinoallomurus vinaceus]|uniref:HTH merR-type domain-containing protein n=1 Tax=Actinoallomurus vinaceus TaxID=1080074 RepID=A0ABP8TZV7_9ACTN
MDGPWTLAELTTKAASVLSDGRSPRPSGRVRDLPNERMIRWYVTIGLVDPPLSRRGRIAVYGPRHLLQLVAVKRRQAEGRSLADIQAELTGATDATLQRIAGLDPLDLPAAGPGETTAAPARPPAPHPAGDSPAPGAPPPGEAAPESAADATRPERVIGESGPERFTDGPASARVARRFWADRPAPPPARGTTPRGAEPAPDTPATAGTRDATANGTDDAFGTISAPAAGALVRGVRLAPGVTLLLDSSPSPDDAAAIVAAAAPLLDLLTERGLL